MDQSAIYDSFSWWYLSVFIGVLLSSSLVWQRPVGGSSVLGSAMLLITGALWILGKLKGFQAVCAVGVASGAVFGGWVRRPVPRSFGVNRATVLLFMLGTVLISLFLVWTIDGAHQLVSVVRGRRVTISRRWLAIVLPLLGMAGVMGFSWWILRWRKTGSRAQHTIDSRQGRA